MELGVTVGTDFEQVDRIGPAFDFVEIGIDGRVVALRDAGTIRTRLEDIGCGLCVHLPFKQELVTGVPEIDEAIVAYLDRLLSWAANAGAQKAVLHGTSRDPHDVELRDIAVSQLEAIGRCGDESEVEVVLENVGHQARGFQLSVLSDLATSANLPVCFDVGHAYMEDRQNGIERFLKATADRVSHLHVHDVRTRGDTHLPLGAGEVDYSPLAERLTDYDGSVAVEVFTDDKALLMDSASRIDRILSPA